MRVQWPGSLIFVMKENSIHLEDGHCLSPSNRLMGLLWSVITLIGCNASGASQQQGNVVETEPVIVHDSMAVPSSPSIDTLGYRQMFDHLVRLDTGKFWISDPVIPKPGAILPYQRIIAYYGNLYSKGMGILGALPEDEMLERLQGEVEKWAKADTLIDARPALHYIAVTAQRDPGKDAKYRLRMPFKEIDKVLAMASRIDALVFLDIQVGHSTVEAEIPLLREYLRLPNVHLGVDPEYSMKDGSVPGKRVGTMYAADINYAADYLAQLVREYNLPPKVLIIHRFKKSMMTMYQDIKLIPEVQLVVNMDGFGSRGKKLTTYRQCITAEPVQFSGFKLFYKNDTIDPKMPFVMQPEEILKLHPVPIYIQYQ